MHSNISQILHLYKTCGYYNNFDSTESLGVSYWCVKTPQCGYMEQGLKHITFYVQKHIAPLAMCYNPPLGCKKPSEAPVSVKLVQKLEWYFITNFLYMIMTFHRQRRNSIRYELKYAKWSIQNDMALTISPFLGFHWRYWINQYRPQANLRW